MFENIVGNATPVELTWTILAVVGIWFSVVNAREAWIDYSALGGRQNGRRRIALDNIRGEGSRLTIYVLYLILGLVASWAPPPEVQSNTAVIGSAILIFTEAVLVVGSVLDRASRVYLMTYGMQSRDESGRFTKEDGK